VDTVQVVTSAETLASQELEARHQREAAWPEAARFLREAATPPTTMAGMAAFRERWGPWLCGRTNSPVWPSALVA